MYFEGIINILIRKILVPSIKYNWMTIGNGGYVNYDKYLSPLNKKFYQLSDTCNYKEDISFNPIYGPIARNLYRVPSVTNRPVSTMKQRYIRFNFESNLMSN